MKKHLIPIVVGIIVMISILVFVSEEPYQDSLLVYDANKDIQMLLVESNIHMSSPLKLNGFSIERYCTFFSDPTIQNSIQYCTSTEILDSKGAFLGNIQMVGSTQEPRYVIGAIQTDGTTSQLDELKIIMQSMVGVLVCTCWEEESPGGFVTISDWIDAAYEHHTSGTGTTSKSTISNLADRHLLLEITTNQEGHLWKFVIS